MTIIHDALKKGHLSKNPLGQNSKNSSYFGRLANPKFEFSSKTKKLNWGPVFVLLALVLITGPVIAPMFQTPIKSDTPSLPSAPDRIALMPEKIMPLRPELMQNLPEKTASPDAEYPSPDKKLQFGAEEIPLSMPAPPAVMVVQKPDFVLNGILFSQKDALCLINGKIVRVGSKVDGAILTEATPGRIILNYRGDKIVIPVVS